MSDIIFMQNWEHQQEMTKQEVMSSHETNNIFIFFTNEVDKRKVIMNFTLSLENMYQKNI